MTSLSSFYHAHSKPLQDTELADRAKDSVKAIHDATDQAMKMSKKAMGWLNRGKNDSSLFTALSGSSSPPPPLFAQQMSMGGLLAPSKPAQPQWSGAGGAKQLSKDDWGDFDPLA